MGAKSLPSTHDAINVSNLPCSGGGRYFWPIPYPYLEGTFGKREKYERRDPPPPFLRQKYPGTFRFQLRYRLDHPLFLLFLNIFSKELIDRQLILIGTIEINRLQPNFSHFKANISFIYFVFRSPLINI